MQKYKTLVHLGYGKSASTTLQSSYFPFNPDIEYYGIDYSNQIKLKNDTLKKNKTKHKIFPNENARQLTSLLVNLDRYQGVDKRLKRNIEEDIISAKKNKKAFVFSNENFSETPSAYLMAKVLKDYIPDAELIIVLRNQLDLVKSVYNFTCHSLKHVPKPYKRRYVSFKSWFLNCIENENKRGGHKAWDRDNDFIRMIDFHHFILCLNEFFKGKINILLYEDLKKNPLLFYKKLSSVIGVSNKHVPKELFYKKVNTSSNKTLVKFSSFFRRSDYIRSIIKSPKFRNHFTFKYAKKAFLRFGKDVYIDNEIKDYIYNRYKEGNKSIAKQFNLPLKKYGYPT